MFDLSSIPGLGSVYEASYYNFDLQIDETFVLNNIPGVYKFTSGLFGLELVQDSRQVHEEWMVTTFDQVLAYIGGYVALVWGTIGALTGWYQQASFDSSFLETFYTQNKQDRHIDAESDDEGEMEATVQNRKPYHHSLKERFKARFIVLLCCCYKQKPWYTSAKKRQHDFIQGMEQL